MIIRIRSKRDGYHRCGVAHPKVATQHAAERFTKAELERLQADPVLTVELLDGQLVESGSADGSASADAGKGAKPAAAKPAKAPAAKAVKAGASAKPAAKPKAVTKPKPAMPPVEPTPPVKPAAEQQEENQQPGSEE
ncbi:MAG: HI1506-related protein [Pseudomonas sp.]|nr:HI1506-related protein [Pseudomonas sp.]